MKRFLPKAISSRIAIFIVTILSLIQIASMFGYLQDRAYATDQVFKHSVENRISAIIEILDRLHAEERDLFVEAINSPTLRVNIGHTQPSESEQGEQLPPNMQDYIDEQLERDVEVRYLLPESYSEYIDNSSHDIDHKNNHQDVPDLFPSRDKAIFWVNLADNSWVTFTISTESTSLEWAFSMLRWIALSIFLIAIFAFVTARRVTAPIRRFAEAAERLGVDVSAPPMDETGSAELRVAVKAFNQMQKRLQRFIADRTQMLAAISHDLRTALTRLRLRIEYIEDEEQLRKAESDLNEMNTMLSSTLSFARDDAENEVRTKADIASILQSLCDDMTDTGHDISYQGPGKLPYTCRPVALSRALTNIVDNALKYGKSADIYLLDSEKEIEIRVHDQGPGIPEEKWEQVFAPFFVIEEHRNKDTGGTGLGLAVARSVIQKHGGKIELANRPSGGLEVRITLPKTVL